MPRLDLLLARNLGLSRRQVTKLVRGGFVVDEHGEPMGDPQMQIAPATLPRTVHVQGRPHALHHRYDLMQHKPLGVVTALRDDRHPTAYALLRDVPLFGDLRAVGRLDKDTCGLLLWTTDGELLHRLTHPRYGIPRRYHVGLRAPRGPWPDALVLDDGHRPNVLELRTLAEQELHPAVPRVEGVAEWATITLASGRFHEVRRIFAALGSEVVSLCRVAYGEITLPVDLAPGEHRSVDLRAVFRGIHPAPP